MKDNTRVRSKCDLIETPFLEFAFLVEWKKASAREVTLRTHARRVYVSLAECGMSRRDCLKFRSLATFALVNYILASFARARERRAIIMRRQV